MSDNNLSISNREPLPIAAPLRPVETPGRASPDSDTGKPLPAQVEVGPVNVKARPDSAKAVREASQPERARPEEGKDVSLTDAVTQMNEFIQSTQRDLRFNIDRETGETVVKVIDRQTEEVIRQIPDEIFLKLARHLDENRDEPVHLFNGQA